MKGQQISFLDTQEKEPPKETKVDFLPIGSKVKITCLLRDNTGIIIKYSLTKNWAYIAYVYKDNPRKIQYAYFEVKSELVAI